jgi:hypothetical protein
MGAKFLSLTFSINTPLFVFFLKLLYTQILENKPTEILKN